MNCADIRKKELKAKGKKTKKKNVEEYIEDDSEKENVSVKDI